MAGGLAFAVAATLTSCCGTIGLQWDPQAHSTRCATATSCADEALALLLPWQLGFEHGPGNATTGAAFRAATVPKATVLATRAVQLDPQSAKAATAHSTALLLGFNWTAAAAEANRAVALNRSDPAAVVDA